jgi:hypothetical protein
MKQYITLCRRDILRTDIECNRGKLPQKHFCICGDFLIIFLSAGTFFVCGDFLTILLYAVKRSAINSRQLGTRTSVSVLIIYLGGDVLVLWGNVLILPRSIIVVICEKFCEEK